MKNCTVWGDLSSDRTSDQYPVVPVCDDCVKSYEDDEESPILSVEKYESYTGDECHFCQKSIDEESGDNF